MIFVIPDSVAYLIGIIKVKGIVRSRIPGMVGDRYEDAIVVRSQLIYDQTSIIAGASRKVRKQLADDESFGRMNRRAEKSHE